MTKQEHDFLTDLDRAHNRNAERDPGFSTGEKCWMYGCENLATRIVFNKPDNSPVKLCQRHFNLIK